MQNNKIKQVFTKYEAQERVGKWESWIIEASERSSYFKES